MQNPEQSLKFVLDYCKKNNVLVEKDLEEKFKFIENQNYEISKIKENEILLKDIQHQLDTMNTYETKIASRSITNILASINYYETNMDDYVSMNNIRDEYMADNVKWISKFEEDRGNDLIFISGHNEHIAKEGRFYKTLGFHLNKIYKDAYLAIGTDFYKTTVNINNIGADNKRSNHSFVSADPLAYNAKNFDGIYYIDFDNVNDGATKNIINSDMNMGSLGEGYSPLMTFIPTSYRINQRPTDLYDSMIFVYEASPISVLDGN